MKKIWITIKKELRSIFRDKKTLVMLFVLPLMIPGFVILYGYMFDNIDNKSEEDTIIGINYKPDTIEEGIIKNNKIKTIYYDNVEDMKKDLKKKNIILYIVLDNGKYDIYMGDSMETASVASNKVVSYLESYNKVLANIYINDKGLDSSKIYENVKYEVHMETDNYILNLIYSIAFTYIIMAIVIASANMALSATAVEKENGTLETILTLPIKREELIIGKHAAGAIMSFIVSIFGLGVTIGSLYIGKIVFKSFNDFNLNLSINSILSSLLVLISASILISGLAISLTAFAKTSKEAQSKTQVLSFLSMIPMFINLLELDVSRIIYLIPVCNYSESLLKIFNGNINIMNIMIVFISSIVYIAIIISIIIRQYKEEKVLFAN